MNNVSKRSDSPRTKPSPTVTGIIKLARMEESEPFPAKYLTETFDFFGHCGDGRKIFESFHVLAVPEGQYETFERLRKQVKQSLVSDLEEVIQNLDEKCRQEN